MRAILTGLVVGYGFMVMFISTAIKGVYQINFTGLVHHYGVGIEAMALAGGFFGLAQGVFSAMVGKLCDRCGASYVLLSGMLSAACAFLLFSSDNSFLTFLLGFLLFAAYAMAALTFVPVSILIDMYVMPERRQLAYVLATNGIAVGLMVLSPIWIYLEGYLSWPMLCSVLAAIFASLAVIPALLNCLGRTPVKIPVALRAVTAPLTPPNAQAVKQTTLASLPRYWYFDRRFLLAALAFSGCGTSMIFIDVHYVPAIQEILQHRTAANLLTGFSLSLLGLSEALGSLLIGYIVSKKVSLPLLLGMLFLLRCATLMALVLWPEPVMVPLFGIFFGITYMGTVIIISRLAGTIFGYRYKGFIFGAFFLIHQLSGLLTAWLGSLLRVYCGSYFPVICFVAVWLALSAGASLLLSIMKNNPDAGTGSGNDSRFQVKYE
ncbi:MFS transporter [Snodgrassella alvi]|uniref:MFS transporter n=1 Tax=Snodgrassella TaxID=1193515 RepID=UPI00351649EE